MLLPKLEASITGHDDFSAKFMAKFLLSVEEDLSFE